LRLVTVRRRTGARRVINILDLIFYLKLFLVDAISEQVETGFVFS